MLLILHHPKVAYRDCNHCQAWEYSEETGKVLSDPRFGGDMPRESPPPCRTERGCPKGTPENPKSLTPRNRQAYEHYLSCKAVGRFPDDPIVTLHAGIIRQIEDAAESARQSALNHALVRLSSVALRKGL